MIPISLFVTEKQPCNYLDDKESQSAFVHPSLKLTTKMYSELITKGFRRSGDEVYAPHCSLCSECIPARLDAGQFKASKNQKRCIKKNVNTRIIIKPAQFEQAHYDIYMRYQNHKHSGSLMANSSEEDYINFLASSWCETVFVEFLIDNKLAAVAIVDLLNNGLSAVYTFFDPKFSRYSLGTYAILWQLNYAKKKNVDFIYLGFWVKDCRKMAYKSQYKPMQGYINKEWHSISQ